jgi:hypothetical protein
MKLLDDYFELQQEIYDYFGYREDWCVIPLDDCTDYYWRIEGNEKNGSVWYSSSEQNQKMLVSNNFDYDIDGIDSDDIFCNEIYTQRFLPKWVYRGKEYTMICVDTRTNGNKFLQIFDNKKELLEETNNE